MSRGTSDYRHTERAARGTLLGHLLRPLTVPYFLREIWTQRFVHIQGEQAKFAELFSWSVLNSILEAQRFTAGRLKLVKETHLIEPRRYHYRPEHKLLVSAPALVEHLRAGATLILNEVEVCHRPLRECAMALEALFGVHVFVNLYAGFGHERGFLRHWDSQDTLILQIAGRKDWKVWAPTRRWPLDPDVSEAPQPTGEPVWNGLLSEGAMFYIPRGWWHVATPVDEPCLHLTVTIQNKTGLELLQWLMDRLRGEEVVRRDIPYLSSPEEQQQHYGHLKRVVLESLRSLDFADSAAAFREAHITEVVLPRPRFTLPQLD